MKNFLILLFFFTFLTYCHVESNEVISPTRTNIYFILDSSQLLDTNKNVKHTLHQLLDGIPLSKYRIAIFGTNLYRIGVHDLQSTTHLVNEIMKTIKKKSRSMSETLDEAKKEAIKYFGDDKNIFVAITNEGNSMDVDHTIDLTSNEDMLTERLSALPFHEVQLPTRSNIYFILDSSQLLDTKKNVENALHQLLDGIPLSKYRIAVFGTNLYRIGVHDLQSTTHLVNEIMKKSKAELRSISETLEEAKKEANKYFSGDKNIFVAITSERNSMDVDHTIDLTSNDDMLTEKLSTLPFHKVQFPTRSNIYFILDSTQLLDTNKDMGHVLHEILDGISMDKYRIAIFGTNLYRIGVHEFQSTTYSVNEIMKTNKKKLRSMKETLEEAKEEANKYFSDDKNIFVSIQSEGTDIPVDYTIDMTVNNDALTSQLSIMPFYKATLRTCAVEGAIVHNECMQECSCVNGKQANCYRVRSMFSKLPLQKRVYYVMAYKELAMNPKYREKYAQHCMLHTQIGSLIIHSFKYILAFHRQYTLMFESLLRLIDCKITIPFWNFAIRGEKAFEPAPNYHIWDNYGGIGTAVGTKFTDGYCVVEGPLAYPDFTYPSVMQKKMLEESIPSTTCTLFHPFNKKMAALCTKALTPFYNPACIFRSVNKRNKLATYDEIIKWTINKTANQFEELLWNLRYKIHTPIHRDLGGTFSVASASFNPTFFLLHSMIDAMWDLWQHKDVEYQQIGKGDTAALPWFANTQGSMNNNDDLFYSNLRVKYTKVF